MTREPYRKWDYLIGKWKNVAWGRGDVWLKELGDDLIKEAEYLFDELETKLDEREKTSDD